MVRREAKTGNEVMAEAMRQVNPDVVAAYPITPATEIVQIFASFVADGLVDTEFVAVESEHSAMSACVGAAAAGARVMTATASQGLALMHEVLYVAAALRLPIVLCDVNRSLSAPINIHCDHSDTMGSRDAGWIQIFSENAQETYDNVVQAVRVAEKALLPVVVTTDGFIISHGCETVDFLEDSEVQEFIGEYTPAYTILDVDNPITLGPLDLQDYFFEHKRQEIQAVLEAGRWIDEVGKEYRKKFRKGLDFLEEYRVDDAELVVLALGSTAGTAKVVVDGLREAGTRAGLVKLRVFRPFPAERLARLLARFPVVAVMDRSDTLSTMGGPVFVECRAALYESGKKPLMVDYVYGLGGRDVTDEDIRRVFSDMEQIRKTQKIPNLITYLGVRE
ncbi:pyruvate ferredoxin oxidoreductase [candidate division TA06 bacterium DG_26]|uniref:Pyruvate ferredoxin oxidoreductase n=1 Tax=candidate division TA06 bacterium DG_26 TaxID=1703771 RepID=A0A0S7WMN7_UNCT6|nr:MAG: pyruvate ferredoxin oxidoreductase [candidate division TA06 bacterium DG_26]